MTAKNKYKPMTLDESLQFQADRDMNDMMALEKELQADRELELRKKKNRLDAKAAKAWDAAFEAFVKSYTKGA